MLLVCVDSKCTGGWTRLRFLPTTDRTNPEPALKNWCVTVDHNSQHLNHSRWERLQSELFPAGVQFLIGQLIDSSYFHTPTLVWLQETKRTFAEVKKCHCKFKGYFAARSQKGPVAPFQPRRFRCWFWASAVSGGSSVGYSNKRTRRTRSQSSTNTLLV